MKLSGDVTIKKLIMEVKLAEKTYWQKRITTGRWRNGKIVCGHMWTFWLLEGIVWEKKARKKRKMNVSFEQYIHHCLFSGGCGDILEERRLEIQFRLRNQEKEQNHSILQRHANIICFMHH